MKTSLFRARPHLWYQLYWVVYLIWFFWLDLTVTDPKYIIHSPLDDFIPFNEWFIFPYGSWFFLLAGVTALLWWFDTASYDKLCLMMFSGMTFCLILYMVLPNGLDIRPTVEEVGRSNIAMTLMQLIWKADASVNVQSNYRRRIFPSGRYSQVSYNASHCEETVHKFCRSGYLFYNE